MYELTLPTGKTLYIEDIGQAHRTALANRIGVKLCIGGKSWECDVSEYGIFIRDKTHPENIKK